MKQLALLNVTSTPSFHKHFTNFKRLFLAESTNFIIFHISTLVFGVKIEHSLLDMSALG